MTEQRSGRRRKSSHREQIDRLSVLPDSVICHILSFLQTKFSVRTSVLSKRWRNLWSYVPTLDFELENQEIINRVMLLHKVQSLTTFRLDYEKDCSVYQLETWITFAIVRNVQKLDIYLPLFDEDLHSSLPRCLFTCKTLVDLKLYSCGVIPLSGVVRLPHLKKLHLFSLQYEADESLPHLLSGCPMLEELELALSHDMASCNISSPTIKRLVLNFMSDVRGDARADRLEINTPSLVYLLIHDYFSEHIKCGVLTSLIEADIELYR